MIICVPLQEFRNQCGIRIGPVKVTHDQRIRPTRIDVYNVRKFLFLFARSVHSAWCHRAELDTTYESLLELGVFDF
jgi:hypothetical protein